MFTNPIKLPAAAVLSGLALLALGVLAANPPWSAAAAQVPAAPPPPGEQPPPEFDRQAKELRDLLNPDRKATPEPLPAGKDAATLLKELLTARRDTARQEVEGRFQEFQAGRGTLELILEAVRRLEKAELQLTDDPKQQFAAYDRSYQLLLILEKVNQMRFEAGRIPVTDLMQSKYARLDAEIDRLRARMRMEGNRPAGPGR
jgi:hypothetical protein